MSHAIAPPVPRLSRRPGAGAHLEALLISAVSVVLAIRLYLFVTGYPQIGGHGLHIAHMLWGGMAMLMALVLLLTVAGERIRRTAAIMAGAGFGLFIDELGKFITSDNNYFFQPAVALIYVTFVAMFLAFRALERRQRPAPSEALAAALAVLEDAALHGLTAGRRRQVAALLRLADPADPLTASLVATLPHLGAAPDRDPGWWARLPAGGAAWLRRVAAWRGAQRAVVALFVLNAAGAVLSLALTLMDDPRFVLHRPSVGFVDGMTMAATAAANGLTAFGVWRLRRSSVAAYQWFRRALLLSIVVLRPFVFYHEEMAAVFGLGADLFTLLVLDVMIHAGQPSPGAPVGQEETALAGPFRLRV